MSQVKGITCIKQSSTGERERGASFLVFGSIAWWNLSLLSSRSVVEVCVMPVLMYGSEN